MRYLLILIILLQCFVGKANNNKTYAPEKIYITVNKNLFVSGESLWYKIYNLDFNTNKLSYKSDIAYIELINSEGIPTVKQNIKLKNGIGNGGFILNKNLPTNHYTLNAYTNWGNSIHKKLISTRSIFIYNPNNITSEQISAESNSSNKQSSIKVKLGLEDLKRVMVLEISSKDSLENWTPTTYDLELLSQNKIEYQQKIDLSLNNTKVKIRLKDLKEPLYLLQIRNLEKHIVYERPIFVRKVSNKNIIEKASLITSKRGHSNIKLKLNDFTTISDTLFMSALIRKKNSKLNQTNILEYINFNKHFQRYKEFIEDQAQIIQTSDTPIWLNFMTDYTISANRYFEKDKFILEGTLIEKKSKQAIASQEIFLSKSGEYSDIIPSKTNKKGQFYFPLSLQPGYHDISLQVLHKDSLHLDFNLKDKFNQIGVFVPLKKFEWQNNLDYLQNLWENHMIAKNYNIDSYEHVYDTIIHKGKTNFYGTPKYTVKLQEYVQLDSLSEYFHELISYVKLKKKNHKNQFHVFSYDENKTMNGKPLILYDGVIIDDHSIILNLNPSRIDRIEVVPYEYFYKNSHFHGIVHIISMDKKCDLPKLPNNTERYYLPILTREVKPAPQKVIPDNYPDLRTCLLWEPNIILTKENEYKLNFRSSDLSGTYELIIEGISESGEPIVYKQEIIVQ